MNHSESEYTSANMATSTDTLSTKLGYVFANNNLLIQALTHSSFVYESTGKTILSNERLEFLGDAVLELLISELLYKQYPNLTEGELSKRRANLVCEPSLATLAKQLEIGEHLLLGKGEATGGGAYKNSILSDALEAIIGAIFLDGGPPAAKSFVKSLFVSNDNMLKNPVYSAADSKSSLQEKIQETSRIPLVYNIIDEKGPAHQKIFTVQVSHDGKILGFGIGKSKKEAEREAAAKALEKY